MTMTPFVDDGAGARSEANDPIQVDTNMRPNTAGNLNLEENNEDVMNSRNGQN